MEEMKDTVLEAAEVSLEVFVEKAYEPLVDGLIEEIKVKIPGTLDDSILDGLAALLKPKMKALLLEQIEKISAKV
jgi:hypothetical protein